MPASVALRVTEDGAAEAADNEGTASTGDLPVPSGLGEGGAGGGEGMGSVTHSN
ncbi:hypothetical protein GCM10018773_39630 [Streptomyces candidus]|nr:hypothetical protein GCM10018773_39630 [Streptomyces candidus]